MAGRRPAAAEHAGSRTVGEVVGREEELERIASFVGVRAGTSRALVIEGTAGIGKTTLWREGLRMLDASGARVLAATPAGPEASLSLSGLTDLLEPVYHLVRTDLPAPQRRALDVALALEDGRSATDDGGRLLRAGMLGCLRALSDRDPLALAVDDSQWLDPESAAALTYALRRLGETRLVCLFSRRLEEPSAFDVSQLGALAVERLYVGPLSLGATQRLLARELGVTYSRPLIRRLVTTSGGNPFYALELARGLERADARVPDEPAALSETLEALVAARLDAVAASARRLLGHLSLLPDASLQLLERLDALDALDDVVAAGLVRVDGGTVRFDHPLLAAGAYARLGPEERRGLHGDLAAALQDPVERGRHLAKSTIDQSAEIAAELAEAARIASSRGVPGLAADLVAAATRVTPKGDVGAERERRLLEAAWRAQSGAFRRSSELLDEVVSELEPGDERAWALRLRAKVTGDIALQRELLERALTETDDPSISAEANALLVRNYLYSGDLDEALTAARLGDAQARRTGDRSRIAAATTTRGLMEIWGTGAPDREVFERARDLIRAGGDLPADTYSNPHTLLGARALYRYELDLARESYTVAAAAAEVTGDVDSLETFWWGLAQLEVRAGRYSAAHEYVDRMRESGDAFDRRTMSLRWIEGVLATYDGRVEDAREALVETLARAEEGENWFFVAYARSALAFLELSLGRTDAVVDVLDPVLTTPFVVRGDPGQTGILPMAAEALVSAGELSRARSLVERLEERGRTLDHPWCLGSAARCRGLLLSEQGAGEAAVNALEESLALFTELPAPLDRGRALLALGTIQRRVRQRRAARRSLEVAVEVFEELGTPLWSARARAELARIGGRPPSRGELTPSELRVAELVGEGKTNREVAAALFVAERTVESALTQIYRKLDVRSRTELARKLADRA